MNSETLTQLLQKSLRVTLGATATLVETLQDPQRRAENLSKLTTELSQLAEGWEAKGTTTESEARNFVNRLWSQTTSQDAPPSTYPQDSYPQDSLGNTAFTPTSEVQQDLQELTVQLAAMRAEIERLRNQGS
jgi:polyhydroxyalkanoate synthesis regulator phasin